MAGGVIATGTHPKLLWPGVKAIWGQVYNEHPEEYVSLFDIDTSEKNYEEDVQVTGFSLAPVKPQGQSVSFTSEVQGPVSRYTHVAYGLGYIVTHEELKDDRYMEVSRRRAKALAMSMRQTVENIGAGVYNNGFTNSAPFLGADGVPLFSASHPNTSGGTYSNVLAVSANLSESAIEDMIVQIMGATSDAGLLISLMPQSLHVARQNYFTANRIVKSVFQTQTANNDVNVVAAVGAFPKGVHMNHYFTSSNAWFIRTNCPNGMKFYWRERTEFSQDNDFDTKNAKAAAYMRFSCGWTDGGRAVFGTQGT